MKKNLIFLSAFAFASMNAFAGEPEIAPVAPPSSFDGPYIGIGVGGIQGNFDTTIDTNFAFASGPVINQLHYRRKPNNGSVIGNAFLGYGQTFQRLYLGGEISGNLSDLHSTTRNSNIIDEFNDTLTNKTKVRLNNGEADIDLRPGILFAENAMVSGRVGAAFNRIKFKSESNGKEDIIPLTELNYSKSNSVVGLRLGAGLQYMFNNNISIRGDYIYTYFGRLSGDDSISEPIIGIGPVILANNTKTKVWTNAVILSASYHFNRLS